MTDPGQSNTPRLSDEYARQIAHAVRLQGHAFVGADNVHEVYSGSDRMGPDERAIRRELRERGCSV